MGRGGSSVPSLSYMCVTFVFCVIFHCWMAPHGRWCCRAMVGPSDVARIMQLLEDDERSRVVARILDVSPSVVSRLWRSYQETGEYIRNRPFPDDNLKTRLFSYIVVSLNRIDGLSTA